MIPRLHPRGTSFKGACAYILHDASNGKTDERVGWSMTRNLSTQDPNWAWHEMTETYWAQDQLKAAAGKDARGRKNTRPVLHYTLSWHKNDSPSPEEMKEAAIASLRVMGLSEHEAVVASHKDKQHLHVHIVVNTVHPETGMTAPMKFSKLELSKWAESYERINGLHCEARVQNNAERARHKAEREREALAALTAFADRQQVPAKAPYVPVKHRATHRKNWIDRKEITARMKAMRTTLDAEIKVERDATWQRHGAERDALDKRTETAVSSARESIREVYRPKWRNLYYTQKKEARDVAKLAGNILERAAYVYRNRDWLGSAGKPLTARQMVGLIRSPLRLQKRVAAIHEQDRRALARASKLETREATDTLWQRHKGDMTALRERQQAERTVERAAHSAQRKSISLDTAKAAIAAEREAEPRPLQRAEPTALSRAEQIKRDMAEWRRRNQDKDFGREL